MSLPPVKVLIIGQDNLFDGMPGLQVHHVLTRPSYTPNSVYNETSGRGMLPSLLRLLLGHYDVAVLPAVDLDFTQDVSLQQKYTRLLLRTLVRSRLARILSRLLRPRRTHIAVLDRYDFTTIHRDAARFLNTESYWKVNLSLMQEPALSFPVRWIGLWTYPPKVAATPIPWEQKDIDIFAAFTLNYPARERALQWLHQLASSHTELHIVIPEKPLPPQEFQNHLARSRICLSPEGIGFHCFRHYESMHHAAVPLITRNPHLITDLQDGINCVLYSDHEEGLTSAALGALRDLDKLAQIARHARDWVKLHHTPQAVASQILQHAIHRSSS